MRDERGAGRPDLDLERAAFIHESARIYGKVRVEEGASIWLNAAIRAEMHEVVVGPYSNVQDFAMLHVGDETPTIVGAYCSVAHHVTLHGCRLADRVLVGVGAIVMDGCEIGEDSVIGGGTLLTKGTRIPPRSVVVGSPGRVVRTRDNYVGNKFNALLYHRNALAYKVGDYRAWSGPDFDAFQAETLRRLEAEARDRA